MSTRPMSIQVVITGVREAAQSFREEEGQDLVEYTLLLSFVALASAALFVNAGGSVSGIWQATSTLLANANTVAQGG